MINVEKYKDELKEIGEYFAISKDGKLSHCSCSLCEKCIFSKGDDCDSNKVKWLLEEYKERPKYKLTKFEYLFLKNLKSNFKYITTNDNNLFVGTELKHGFVNNAVVLCFGLAFEKNVFQFIKPEQPYKIAEILNDCEVIKKEDEKNG